MCLGDQQQKPISYFPGLTAHLRGKFDLSDDAHVMAVTTHVDGYPNGSLKVTVVRCDGYFIKGPRKGEPNWRKQIGKPVKYYLLPDESRAVREQYGSL